MRAVILAAAAFAMLPMAVSAAPTIADGVYACTLEGKAVGRMKLEAGRFYGLVSGNDFGEAKTFITMDPNRIFWIKEDLGELTKAGYRPDKTEIRQDSAKGFDITLLKPDQSGFVTASCRPS